MALCVDIGGSFMKFGRISPDGTVEMVERVPTPSQSWAAFVAALADLCARHATPDGAPETLGISTAGLIDPDTGAVTTASNIPGIVGHRLAPELATALGRRVRVAKAAYCFALAEATVGVARGKRVVFGVILGTGVGGGLVIGGRLVVGAGGVCGEWGHGPIVKPVAGSPPIALTRLRCGCGQLGCLETIGSARGLERLHQQLAGAARDSEAIVADWQRQEPEASRTIAIYLELMSEPLAMLINAVGADLLPVGGGLGSATALITALDATTRRLILRPTPAPILVPAELGPNAGLIGAAVLAQQEDAA